MILLAIDTATPATVVGLRTNTGETLQARDDPAPGERPGHATRLLPLAAELISRSGLSWQEIDRIAVGVGPGTFTGLRVGIATAHGLTQSSGAELVGVSSPRALALGARGEGPVLGTIDARRGELFLAGYHGDVELFAPLALPPEAVPGFLARHPALTDNRCAAVGEGAILYRAWFERAGAYVPEDSSATHRIAASALCELGAAAQPQKGPVLPDYLRRPDAAVALEGTAG